MGFTKTIVVRRFKVRLRDVLDTANSGWSEIRDALRRHLERGGFYRADAVADALIEEARARASSIVKRSFERSLPKLEDKVARYIIAFALAEELVEEEEMYGSSGQ